MAAASDGTGCGDLSTVSELRVRDALTSGYRTTVGNSGPETATTMMMTDDDDEQVEPEVDEDGGSLTTTDDCTSTRANSSELMSPIGDRPSSSSGTDVEQSTGWRCYVGRVVAELVDTERTYVRDLNDVIQGYLGCCINNISNNGGSCFSNEDVAILFGNIKDIHLFNSNFLASLDQCQLDPVRIANCFMDHSQGFTIYSDYCTNYPRSLAVLDKLMQDSMAANLFWRQQVSLHHELPVGSYLLKPVQRLFKYQLLLQSLLSHCVEDSDASVAVSVALKSMVGVARSINEWKRDHERAIRVAEMQGLLDDGTNTDLSSLGELLLEDKFKLSGAKTYRHLFLFQKGLLIAKRKEDGNFQIKASITCNNLMLVETVQKAPLSFNLIPFNNPRMQFTVQARTMEQKRQWCCQIKKLILDSYESVIPDKAKQLVLTLVHNQDEASDASSAEHINSSSSSVAISQCSDRGMVHRKSAGYIADLATLKSIRVLQRSESVNSSFRSYEAIPEGSRVTPINSGESSTSHSNQSLHSLRGGTAAWRSSWCSSTGSPHDAASSMNGHGGGGIAPTAIAEIVSDEDSPKRTPPNRINYVSTADASQHHHSRTSDVTSGSSRAAASRDAFEVAVVRAKSDLMKAKPLRSASVDRRPMQSASVAEGGRLNGSSRYPLTGSQSVRVSDYVPRPFVRHNTPTASGDGWQRSSSKKSMTVFGVASHVEPSATTLDRSCERLLRLCTPPRSCGQPANNGGKSDVSSLGLMTSRSAAGSVGHRSTPPRAVVESDLEEEITGEVRFGPATSLDSDYGVNRLRRETSLTDASFDHVTGHVNDASNPSQSHGNLADDQGTWLTQLSHFENGCGSGKVKDDSNVLMKSLYFEQRQASNGGPRKKRSGSYHGLAHHSVTVADSKTRRESTTSNVKSPVDSFKNALTTLAEKFSGRRSGTNVSTATPPVLAAVERGRQQGDGCVLSLDSNQEKTANPVVVVERGGIVSRLIARASGRFPKRRSKSGDRADGGRRRHRDLSTADVTRVTDNDVGRPSERFRLGANLRSRSPELSRRTTGAPCSRSKSVDLDLCETTDFDASRDVGNGVDESSYGDDEDDGTICQLICGGPSWSDGINQKPPLVINKLESKDAGSGGTTRRHQVPFIDDSESEE